MLDCEMDELGAAVEIVGIHYLIFVKFDSAGGNGQRLGDFLG